MTVVLLAQSVDHSTYGCGFESLPARFDSALSKGRADAPD